MRECSGMSPGRARLHLRSGCECRAVLRTLVSTVIDVGAAVVIAVAAAVALAAFRGGAFQRELGNSLWIVAALTLLVALFSFSPSTRRAPDELLAAALGRRFRARHPDEGGAGLGLTVILALASVCMFGIALLYTK